MTLAEIGTAALGGGGVLLVLLTLIQITPIKVNPWSALAKAFGKAINADVLKELENVRAAQNETRQVLDKHIQTDDERNADSNRQRILQFNLELMENKRHTREDFVEVLGTIDKYRDYCKANPDYPNARATHAVANIERVYDDRLKKNDFLQGGD